MKKLITVVGARPQFIKAATVSRALGEYQFIEEKIVHTGQHYDDNMSRIFFDELSIPSAHFHLGVGSGTQGKQTADMLFLLEQLFLDEKPDAVLVFGDTNSTLAAALAAAKLHVPLAHVEAGLRSFNKKMPEEINRLIADQVSDVLFTPTMQAAQNLKLEGYADSRIVPVGDVMYDAALFYSEKAALTSHILDHVNIQPKQYILATLHRAENTNDENRLRTSLLALEQLSSIYPVIMPVHPRTRKVIERYDPGFIKRSPIRMIEPVGFFDMIMLEKNAVLIITDSGGVQKEAFFYHVPCLTLREETEWIETVQLGWNTLVKPDDIKRIYTESLNALHSKGLQDQYPYGHGCAGGLIAEFLNKGI